jgi:hypothetical protein
MKKPLPADALPMVMNRDQMHLSYAETRISGLIVNAPGSAELARVRAAREEILGRISPRDLAAFRKAANLREIPEQRPVDAKR